MPNFDSCRDVSDNDDFYDGETGADEFTSTPGEGLISAQSEGEQSPASVDARFDWLFDLDVYPFHSHQEADYADRRLSELVDEEMMKAIPSTIGSLATAIANGFDVDTCEGRYSAEINGSEAFIRGDTEGTHNISLAERVVVDHILQTLYTFVSSQLRPEGLGAGETFELTDEALIDFVYTEFDEAPLKALRKLRHTIDGYVRDDPARVRRLYTEASWNVDEKPAWWLYSGTDRSGQLLASYPDFGESESPSQADSD